MKKLILSAIIFSFNLAYSQVKSYIEFSAGGAFPSAPRIYSDIVRPGYSAGFEYGLVFNDIHTLGIGAHYSESGVKNSAFSNKSSSALLLGLTHIASYKPNSFINPYLKFFLGIGFISLPSSDDTSTESNALMEYMSDEKYAVSVGIGLLLPFNWNGHSLGLEGNYNILFSDADQLKFITLKIVYRVDI